MAHIRTVTLRRGNETVAVDILRCDDGTRYAAWPAIPNANCKWIGNSFRELSIKWGREGWVAVVGPDQQETLNVAEVELAASQLLEFEDTRKGRRVTLLNLMRDVANLKSLVDLLSLREEKDHEKCLKDCRELRLWFGELWEKNKSSQKYRMEAKNLRMKLERDD